jgi:hypothetical protein
MWKLVYGSAQGTSHRQSGKPCQDFAIARVVKTAFGTVLIAACADGAGSAEHSEVGARIAVETFLSAAEVALDGGLDPSAIDDGVLRSWNRATCRQVEAEADSIGVNVRQLACTLLTAVIGPDSTAFSQIGDGVIILDGQEGYEFAFWPDSGEYANTTRFLTDTDSDQHFRSDCQRRAVLDLAILTDGLQMLALSFAEGRVHQLFFKPIFDALRSAPDGEAMKPSLEVFLDSKRVNERTDDDKTLILATHTLPASHAPIGPLQTD